MARNRLDGLYSIPWVNSKGTSCISCKHYMNDGICKAFPSGIPETIWIGKTVHSKPYENENILFEALTIEDTKDIEYEENMFDKPLNKRSDR